MTESSETLSPQRDGAVNFKTIDLRELQIGAVLRSPIYDSRNVLLLAAGSVITSQIMRQLANRGVVKILIREDEFRRMSAMRPQGTATKAPPNRNAPICPFETADSKILDAQVPRVEMGVPPQQEPISHEFSSQGAGLYDPVLMERLLDEHEQSVNYVSKLHEAINESSPIDAHLVQSVVDDSLSKMSTDPDLFACLGINPYGTEYPGRHSLHCAMLAMLIAAQLGLDRSSTEELCIGCLLHDAGMLHIEPVYQQRKVLNEVEFTEIMKHPVKAFDIVTKHDSVPPRSALVVYQMHERCDGSGYPRKRSAAQIHYFAKIAAVADTFLGLVSERPHRRAMMPYHAIVKMLEDARAGLFDSDIMRALLKAISLFPVGSYLELSDGSVARVLRSNPEHYDRPIVEVWSLRDTDGESKIIDLAQVDDLKIKQPLGNMTDVW